MKRWFLIVPILGIILAACNSTSVSSKPISKHTRDNCPVTQPPAYPFYAPKPHPSQAPYEDMFWFGSNKLWTMLPTNGTWEALPFHEHSDGEEGHYGQKVLWWREGYDYTQEEQRPELITEIRNLDAPAEIYSFEDSTNLYHNDVGSAMLIGVGFPSLGCWEVTGKYHGQELAFVIWIAP